ncbi:hypothetical protein A3L09_07180 [Thermococcus profundus]|uniref:Uncharacterized protein n=1 Tax=Thermococcus profundus TaxID=49899 RepID=A0A2Z2MC16_THEPR|nr:hypothetical protein A3L09_07180 [Thermococcus profundus]
MDGETYWITYYKYHCKVQPNQSAPVYEYEVEKWLGKENVRVYGTDMTGNKVDVGEHEVYAYKTKITPINAKSITEPVTITVWSTILLNDTFIYPWNILWLSSMSPYGGNSTFVGFRIEYRGAEALVTNPSAFQRGLFPYLSDESHVLSQISDDLGNVYLGWVATISMGFWYEWSTLNLLQPHSGVWDDMRGHTITWSTSPDGTAEYGGHEFLLIDYSWSYAGASENVSLSGSGKFSPYLPLLVQGEGHYSYKDEKSGKTTVIYAYIKLEDIKLERESG